MVHDLSNLFHAESLLNDKEDAANKFACNYYTVGAEIIGKVNDRLSKLVDNCDNVQGFVVTCKSQCCCDDTGSELGAVDYRKKSNLDLKYIQFQQLAIVHIIHYYQHIGY